MTVTREFFTFLTCIAMLMVYHCKADSLPPPTGLSYRWLDPFTVNVSWQKPRGVADGEVQYKYRRTDDATDNSLACSEWRNFTENLLTEETGSDRWTFEVWTVGIQNCGKSLNDSTHVSVTIQAPKPRAEVKDIKCFISNDDANCSWISGSQPFNISYRTCGRTEEVLKSLKECDQPYSSRTRNGCYLKFDAVHNDICMVVTTEAGQSTFKPPRMIHSPKLNIKEENNCLNLSWTLPEIIKDTCWELEVCFKQCNMPKVCRTLKYETQPMQVTYDKRCRYEFQSRAKTTTYCGNISSDFGDVVFYGTSEPPDETLTVVAIVVPIILSACIILSCYCFRRHSSIICPIIPDPSAIFKEMMMNGNKEVKTAEESLYTPMPEPVESCKITLITENSILQQNS
ncbi:interleukin-13 receptor subunit alpha-1-like isoform X1 [Epinephelus fuscoguttatus]|uniref:interleukin-13 receptor subunit alpha-1-like isoform X1 n=1 Tax=Epinephelus fuscoguttatus TaxID=293821 RepID=UPI0020D0DF7F|nr:interleukin-13 receptor subunit alpha-1-like isoform X1 [Epinephelus fuscoguttatus]